MIQASRRIHAKPNDREVPWTRLTTGKPLKRESDSVSCTRHALGAMLPAMPDFTAHLDTFHQDTSGVSELHGGVEDKRSAQETGSTMP
jgi:hypothetical protein